MKRKRRGRNAQTAGLSNEPLKVGDTLLIVGSSFPYLEYYPRNGQARVVQIDADARRIKTEGSMIPTLWLLYGAAAALAVSEDARSAARVAAKEVWQRGGHEPGRAAAATLAAVREMPRVA